MVNQRRIFDRRAERMSIEAVLTVASAAQTSDLRSAPGLLAPWLPMERRPASVQPSGARLCPLTIRG
jgi:hypothetical protein